MNKSFKQMHSTLLFKDFFVQRMVENKAKVSKVSKKKGENFLLVKILSDFLSHSAIRVYSCIAFSVLVNLTAVKTARCLSLH